MDKVIISAKSNIPEEKLYTEKAVSELKAENERLKEENERLKQEWRLDCLKCEYKNTKADVDKYKQALQEIRCVVDKAYYTEDYMLGQRFTELVDAINMTITNIIGAE